MVGTFNIERDCLPADDSHIIMDKWESYCSKVLNIVACTAIAMQQANKQRCYATRF
jgi:hypothetical protein